MALVEKALWTAFAISGGLILQACAGSDGGAQQCAVTEDCAADARCTDGTCVANRPPVARAELPGGLEAFALATLDGSASTDPDRGDAVASHAWRVVALEAPCAAPSVAGTGPRPQVRFGCPGRFRVELTVSDALGAASAPAAAELVVLPATTPSVVTALADVAVGHRCSGDPVVCTPDTADGRVPLGAALAGAPAGVRLLWTAVPPEGLALDAGRRATFEPGPDAAAPHVRLATDGGALAGDWVFRVEALDAFGVLGAAAMRVSVGNRAPVIDFERDPLPHRFDAEASRFTASGEIRVFGYDPDGDPLVRRVESRAVNAGPAAFTVVDLGDRITFSILVPYATPADAALLVGGAGLERSIALSLTDANGAVTRETWPVVVENQPPALVAPVPALSVNHRFDAGAAAYAATARLARFTDPDGDPLFQGAPTGDVLCPDVAVGADGVAVLSCAQPYVGTPALQNFVGAHAVLVLARDPWAAAEAPDATTLQILNRPPAHVPQSYGATASCGAGECCRALDPRSCDDYYTTFGSAPFRAEGFVTDPDGDPLLVTTPAASAVCEPAACAFDLILPSGHVCDGDPGGRIAYSATDGVATLASDLVVVVTCGG